MLLNILLVILVLVCVALTGVILLQRSEGGALGMGGGPQGMFTARGAGDLLTRTTSILAATFFILSLAITLLAGHERASSSVTQRLKVNPIDLNALTRSAQGAAPAQSSGEAAPPLPTAAPPLPTAMPTQAPRPTLGAVPGRAPRATGGIATGANSPLANITVAPRAIRMPRPDLNGAAPASTPPASQ